MLGAALRQWSKVITLALLGAIGFSGGVFFASIMAFQFGYPSSESLFMGLFVAMGAFGGGAIGIGLMRWRLLLGLALAGTFGGLIGGAINLYTVYNLGLGIILPGMIGGALLGAALGFLEPVTEREGEGAEP
jgi:hypothetical protein